MSENIYSWSFSSKKERSNMWYIIALSVVIWLVIWWFLTKQYWMSFVIIILVGIIYFIENNSDDIVNVEIWNLWIKIWKNFYDYSKIVSYNFIYEWEFSKIIRLSLNKKWIKVIDLDVDNKITLELKNILPNFIKEWEKQELSFTEKIIKLINL